MRSLWSAPERLTFGGGQSPGSPWPGRRRPIRRKRGWWGRTHQREENVRPKHRRTLPSALRSLGSPSRQPLRGGWACLGWASRTMLLLGGQPKGRGREGARYEHSPENDPGREGVVVQLSSPVMGGGCPPAPGSYWSRCPRGWGRQMSRHAALPHVFDMCLSCSLDILGDQGLSSVLWGIRCPCCGRGLIKAWVSSRLHVLREAR